MIQVVIGVAVADFGLVFAGCFRASMSDGIGLHSLNYVCVQLRGELFRSDR